MLKWTGEDDSSVEVEFSKYQFPATLEDYDANWVVLHLRLNRDSKAWETDCACFLTWDVTRLRNWFQEIELDKTSNVADTFVSLEQDITFKYQGYKTTKFKFIIQLRWGCKPPWTKRDRVVMKAGFSESDLSGAVEYLKTVEAKLPLRGELGKKWRELLKGRGAD